MLKNMFEGTVGQLEANNKHLSKKNRELAAQLSSQEEISTSVRGVWILWCVEHTMVPLHCTVHV